MRRSSAGRPAWHEPGAHVVGEVERGVEVEVPREDRLGVTGREVAALVRLTGLEQHGLDLRGRRHRWPRLDVVERSIEPDGRDRLRCRPGAGGRGGGFRAGVQPSESAPADGEVLVRLPVAIAVGQIAALAEVGPGPAVVGRHQVPAGAADRQTRRWWRCAGRGRPGRCTWCRAWRPGRCARSPRRGRRTGPAGRDVRSRRCR